MSENSCGTRGKRPFTGSGYFSASGHRLDCIPKRARPLARRSVLYCTRVVASRMKETPVKPRTLNVVANVVRLRRRVLKISL